MCGGNPGTRRALLVRQYRPFQASRSAAYWLPKERDYCCFLAALPFGWRSMTYPRGSNPHHAIKPLRRVTAIWLLTRRRQPGLVGPAGVAPAIYRLFSPCARLSGPSSVCSALPTLGGKDLSRKGLHVWRVDQARRGGAGGCRTRTFAALASRMPRRCSFPEELPAPYSARPLSGRGLRPAGSPFGGCPRPRCFAPSLRPFTRSKLYHFHIPV